MKLNVFITIFLGSVMLTNLNAQVPGYRGQKTLIELSAPINMFVPFEAFTTEDLSRYSDVSNSSLIVPQINIDYTIARKNTIGISYCQRNNDFTIPTATGFRLSESEEILHKMTTKDIRLKYTWYLKNWSLAPLGRYIYASAGYMFGTPKNATSGNNLDYFSTFNAHFGWGKRYILANHLTFNIGFEIGLTSGLLLKGGEDDIEVAKNNNEYNRKAKFILKETTFTDTFLKFTLALGGIF